MFQFFNFMYFYILALISKNKQVKQFNVPKALPKKVKTHQKMGYPKGNHLKRVLQSINQNNKQR